VGEIIALAKLARPRPAPAKSANENGEENDPLPSEAPELTPLNADELEPEPSVILLIVAVGDQYDVDALLLAPDEA
jgi:hypothetical protein